MGTLVLVAILLGAAVSLAVLLMLVLALYMGGKMFRHEFGIYGALALISVVAAVLFWITWNKSFYFAAFQVFVMIVGVIRQDYLMSRSASR